MVIASDGDVKRWIRQSLMQDGQTVGVGTVDCLMQLLPQFFDDPGDLYRDKRLVDETVRALLSMVLEHHQFSLQQLMPQHFQKLADGGVFGRLLGGAADDPVEVEFVSAFEAPRFKFNPTHNQFTAVASKPSIMPSAEDKANMFRERFYLVQQRLLRRENFRPRPVSHINTSDQEYLKNLLGCEGQSFLLFGFLSQIKQGQWSLEDLDADVDLDLSSINIGMGMFTETCLVLVNGTYYGNNLFKVDEMAMPPIESRRDTLMAHKMLDFFSPKQVPLLHEHTPDASLEADEWESAVIVLSDVWLNEKRVLDKLGELLNGYSSAGITPFMIVLMGDFLSPDVDTAPGGNMDGRSVQRYQTAFMEMARLIARYTDIAKKTHFVFVPGPNDPWAARLHPRPSLPHLFTAYDTNSALFQGGWKRFVKRASFLSNPARLRIKFKHAHPVRFVDLVLYRENLLGKLQRNLVTIGFKSPDEYDPKLPTRTSTIAVARRPSNGACNLQDEKRLYKHLVHTIASQAHLCPLPNTIAPKVWSLDHAFQLYPLPDAILLGDRSDAFETKLEDGTTHCVNPGSFSVSGFGFITYFPASGRVEMSQISD